MKTGDTAWLTRRYSAEDIRGFSALAKGEIAVECVPEPLIAALFSYLLGVKLPGAGTNYLKQELRFIKSARLEAELTARVTITRLRPEKHLCDLETRLSDEAGETLAIGRALVSVRDVGAAL